VLEAIVPMVGISIQFDLLILIVMAKASIHLDSRDLGDLETIGMLDAENGSPKRT
jgi:hypothetical protein